MKAKLGNTIIDFWKISTSKPKMNLGFLNPLKKGRFPGQANLL